MKIDTTLLRSMSVSQDEVEALELDPGDAIRCKGKTYYWDKPMVLMVDRLNRGENAWHTTMIRQALECPYGDWGHRPRPACPPVGQGPQYAAGDRSRRHPAHHNRGDGGCARFCDVGYILVHHPGGHCGGV